MKLSKSFELLHRAENLIPICSQTFSKSPTYFPKGVSPVYLESGSGSHVIDADGNMFIDYICGLGPITLGYNYPAVNNAIIKQLNDGIIFSLPHPLEVELSEKLTQVIPCAEMVRFLKTGSEATQAAVRAARAYTGKNKIAFRGYHGWHSEFAIGTERPKGIPRVFGDYLLSFEYNNISSLEELFERHDDVAAVIMEPTIIEPPHLGFLQSVLELAHKYGALLLFDETVTGFRMSLGGAQEYFGVVPDLATFGKGAANGMPLSAVVGKRDIMQQFEEIFVSSTFGGECLSLAASLATINEMQQKDTIKHMWGIGMLLISGLNSIGIETKGYPCRPMMVIPDDSPEMRSLLQQELIRKGILIHNSMVLNLCYSHSKEDIDTTIDAIDASMLDIKSGKVKLEGEIARPAFRRL